MDSKTMDTKIIRIVIIIDIIITASISVTVYFIYSWPLFFTLYALAFTGMYIVYLFGRKAVNRCNGCSLIEKSNMANKVFFASMVFIAFLTITVTMLVQIISLRGIIAL